MRQSTIKDYNNKVLLQSWKKYREVYRLGIDFKQSLLIAVVLYTLKRRSLIQDFVFFYIWPESFQSLLWYVKYDEYFGIQKIWQSAA
jgi:hypothetical protein